MVGKLHCRRDSAVPLKDRQRHFGLLLDCWGLRKDPLKGVKVLQTAQEPHRPEQRGPVETMDSLLRKDSMLLVHQKDLQGLLKLQQTDLILALDQRDSARSLVAAE